MKYFNFLMMILFFSSCCLYSQEGEITNIVITITTVSCATVNTPLASYLQHNQENFERLGFDISDSTNNKVMMIKSAQCVKNGQAFDWLKRDLVFPVHYVCQKSESIYENPSIPLEAFSLPLLWPENLLKSDNEYKNEIFLKINGKDHRAQINWQGDVSTFSEPTEQKDQTAEKSETNDATGMYFNSYDSAELIERLAEESCRQELPKKITMIRYLGYVSLTGVALASIAFLSSLFNLYQLSS